jgi:hypothetical protein
MLHPVLSHLRWRPVLGDSPESLPIHNYAAVFFVRLFVVLGLVQLT